jgi:hypothetical protein
MADAQRLRCPACDRPADAALSVAALGTGPVDATGASVCTDAKPAGEGWDVFLHFDGGVSDV